MYVPRLLVLPLLIAICGALSSFCRRHLRTLWPTHPDFLIFGELALRRQPGWKDEA